MPGKRQTSRSKRPQRRNILHIQWKTLHMTPFNGTPDTSPAEWQTYAGRLPKSNSEYWDDASNWPQFVILDPTQVVKVLERFAIKHFPHRLPLSMIRRYIRNFDSEGYAVDSSLTVDQNWSSLPLDHRKLLVTSPTPVEDTDEASCGSDNDDERLVEIATEANRLLSHEESGQQTDANALEEIRDTVCSEPPGLAAASNASCLAARQSLNAPLGNSLEQKERPVTPNQQLGVMTPPISPCSTKGPLKIMKRLAEGPELRQEVKRLRAVIDEHIDTESELQHEVDYCKQKIHEQEIEVEQREEAMQQYMDEESELQNELDSCRYKIIEHWRAFDVMRREVQSLNHERSASDGKLRCLEKRVHAEVNRLQHDKAALKDKLEKWTNVLATVLFWLDRLYREISTNDDDEQDEFLAGIKADLGSQECDELLRLGKALCNA